VYALGVLLYKLMTGTFPCTVEGQPIYEAVRIIREDEPVRPSKRDPELRGDLESIILRSIAKDRSRRYPSVSEMAADIVRFLNRQPIRTASAGVGARSRHWLHRRRRSIAIASVVLLLGSAAGLTAWLMQRDDSTGRVDAGDQATNLLQDWAGGAADGFGSKVRVRPRPIPLSRQRGRITTLVFDSTGTRLLSVSADHTLVVWDVLQNKAVSTFKDHGAELVTAAFSDTPPLIASLDDDGSVFIRAVDGQGSATPLSAPCSEPFDLATDSAGASIAIACADGTVRAYDVEAATWRTLRSTTGPFECVAMSADGRLILGGSQRGSVYLWNAATNDRVHRLQGLNAKVVCVTVEQQSRYVLAVDVNGQGLVWRAATGANPQTIDGAAEHELIRFDACEAPAVTTSVSANGHWLVAASVHTLRLWDLRRLGADGLIEQHGGSVSFEHRLFAVALDANAQRLALGRDDGTVEVYSVADLLDWVAAPGDSP
jgi:hypothetical protein